MSSDETSRKMMQTQGLVTLCACLFVQESDDVCGEERSSHLQSAGSPREVSRRMMQRSLISSDLMVKQKTALRLRHFYQAEILVPSPLPPHLITCPQAWTLTLFCLFLSMN